MSNSDNQPLPELKLPEAHPIRRMWELYRQTCSDALESARVCYGVDGRTVQDNGISARDGKDATVPKGRNTLITEDGGALIAKISGQVYRFDRMLHPCIATLTKDGFPWREGEFVRGEEYGYRHVSRGA